MGPLLTPPSLAGPSVAHRRWLGHRLMLALAASIHDDRRWASAACGVRVAGGVRRPTALVADGEPPGDGVLARLPLLVVELGDAGEDPVAWHAAGVPAAWRLRDEVAEVVDERGRSVVALPGELCAAAAGVRLAWPLPAGRRAGRPARRASR